MHQQGGYSGPVAHWWQNRFQYTGPGLDWRYEGILIGYATLYKKTGEALWKQKLNQAAQDLIKGQLSNGSYCASRFEINPDTLGTPHEAGASLGLLWAIPYLKNSELALAIAKRNVDNLINKLWDGQGFNDASDIKGRVPNKLATFAYTLIMLAKHSGEESYLPYAQAALNDVLNYQVTQGPLRGVVHQYAPNARKGDGRFFPFYNARCVPPLLLGAKVFDDESYSNAAQNIISYLEHTMLEEGSWPQIHYSNGKQAHWPRWLAGVADILLAFLASNQEIPQVALERLLDSQSQSGAFPTAEGFAAQINQLSSVPKVDYRDVIPVVGWNDKVLRLLSYLLNEADINKLDNLSQTTSKATYSCYVGKQQTIFEETSSEISIKRENGDFVYYWQKHQPWAKIVLDKVRVQ